MENQSTLYISKTYKYYLVLQKIIKSSLSIHSYQTLTSYPLNLRFNQMKATLFSCKQVVQKKAKDTAECIHTAYRNKFTINP